MSPSFPGTTANLKQISLKTFRSYIGIIIQNKKMRILWRKLNICYFDILLDFRFKVVQVIVGWQDFSIGAREGWP